MSNPIRNRRLLNLTKMKGGFIPPEPPYVVSDITTLSAPSYIQGNGPSTSSPLYKIYADNVGSTITVTLSNSNFEQSSDGINWQTTPLSVSYPGGVFVSMLKYRIRLKAGLSVGSYTGQITLTATGATPFVINIDSSVAINTFIAGLVLALNLDQSSGTIANDSSGRKNDGQLGGNILPSWSTGGVVNNCLDFQGTVDGTGDNSTLTVATRSDWTFADRDFTMCCWITPLNTSGYWCAFDLGYTFGAGILIEFQPSSQIFRVYVNGPHNYDSVNTGITPGNTYFVLLRRIAGRLDLFIDTRTVLSVFDNSNIVNSGQSITIGAFGSSGENLSGKGDIFYIWKGRGITNSELDVLYNSGNGLQPATTPSWPSIMDKLLVSYNFDGDSNDFFGINNGIDASVSYQPGIIGQSAHYLGSDASLTGLSYDINILGNFSIFSWINITSFSGTFNPIISDNGNCGLYVLATGSLDFYNGGDNFVLSTLGLNTWYFVGVTYDGSNLKFYIDGTLFGTVPYTLPSIFLDRIGSEGNSSSHLNGNLDLLSIWEREITSTEVAFLYNAGAGRKPPYT